ncbi:MAG: biotin synthase BioB [Gammaproteobacteria bacterium]|nr:biotin synthase BioB [Gammaproteobacteria bacterium]
MPDNIVYQRIDDFTHRVLNGGEISTTEARWLLSLENEYLSWLMAGADRIRKNFRGEEIEACAISNVRSGNCSENCSFCAQSGHYKTESPVHNYIPKEQLLEQAEKARQWGVSDLGIVSKGWGVRSEKEHQQLGEYFDLLSEQSDIGRCASLGVLDANNAQRLKQAGLENYHHNLECAESFFDEVCSTHTYQENIDTIKVAREAGMRVCSGGILGMGENLDQRIELAETLRRLDVESVPLNFLSPVLGTPMGDRQPMQPMEILQTIAVFRYMLPRAEIRIAGGRQFLRDLQAMIFMAGASGIMIGDYLTTKGRQVEDDLQMMRDLGLQIRGDTQQRRQVQANKKLEDISVSLQA